MRIFVSCRNLGDAVIHARAIAASTLRSDDAVVVTTKPNSEVFELFGLKTSVVELGSGSNSFFFRAVTRIRAARSIARHISHVFAQGGFVHFLYGDLFDRAIGFFMAGGFVRYSPKSDISSIFVNQKIPFKAFKNISLKKPASINYYFNLSDYLGVRSGGLKRLEPALSASKRGVLIAPFGSAAIKDMDISVLEELFATLERQGVAYRVLVEAERLRHFKNLRICDDAAVVTAPIADLPQLLHLHSHLICVDSFIMHLAGAVGLRSLVFTGANKPYYWLHEKAVPAYTSGGCEAYPCSNFPLKACGLRCKRFGAGSIQEMVNVFLED